MNYNATTYALYSQPYLDKKCQCYKNIITINLQPKGPLETLVRKIRSLGDFMYGNQQQIFSK